MSCCALDAPRLIDNPFEHPHNRVAFQGAVRVFAVRAHVVQHLCLALGLIHFEPERLFQFADFERAMGALAEQLDEPFVELIDPLSGARRWSSNSPPGLKPASAKAAAGLAEALRA